MIRALPLDGIWPIGLALTLHCQPGFRVRSDSVGYIVRHAAACHSEPFAEDQKSSKMRSRARPNVS